MRVNAQGSMFRVGRTASGFVVQVEGRGTLSRVPPCRNSRFNRSTAREGRARWSSTCRIATISTARSSAAW